MMMGVKLQGAERWRAWGAVALLTLLAVLQYTGNFMPAYFNEQVLACALYTVTISPADSDATKADF